MHPSASKNNVKSMMNDCLLHMSVVFPFLRCGSYVVDALLLDSLRSDQTPFCCCLTDISPSDTSVSFCVWA